VADKTVIAEDPEEVAGKYTTHGQWQQNHMVQQVLDTFNGVIEDVK
jgi:hypothetical protein